MPRYLVVRTFDVSEEEMPEIGRRSNEVIEGGYPQIVWEHSHVVVDQDGRVMTYCVYESPAISCTASSVCRPRSTAWLRTVSSSGDS